MRRMPIPKKPVVRIRWGSTYESSLDYHVAWGEGVARASARWLVCEIYKLNDELIKRGFDRSTLRFEVAMAKQREEGA